LGGGGHAIAHRELREKATHLVAAELVSGPAVNKGLKLPHPEAIGSEGFPGVVPELDSSLQVAEFLLPGSPAPEPVPAALQRLPKFLWQPAASQLVRLIPPTLGRSLARIERASARRQAEKPPKIRLYSPGWEE